MGSSDVTKWAPFCCKKILQFAVSVRPPATGTRETRCRWFCNYVLHLHNSAVQENCTASTETQLEMVHFTIYKPNCSEVLCNDMLIPSRLPCSSPPAMMSTGNDFVRPGLCSDVLSSLHVHTVCVRVVLREHTCGYVPDRSRPSVLDNTYRKGRKHIVRFTLLPMVVVTIGSPFTRGILKTQWK